MAEVGRYSIEHFVASDGYRFAYRHYPARGTDRSQSSGHLVCLHGIQSHGGWYETSCTAFSDAGYVVSFLDRRGSGINESARGDTPSYQRLVQDVTEFVHRPGLAGEDSRIYLLGISWGGKVAAAAAARLADCLEGLLLLCPGFCPQVRPRLRDRAHIAWGRIVAPTRQYSIPLNDPRLFTSSPQWQEFVASDPLALRQATARLLVESVRLDRHLRKIRGSLGLPVLLLLAEQDRIIDNAATRKLVGQLAPTSTTILEYPGAHHTLEFEPEPGVFIRDVLCWLGQRQALRTSEAV